MNDDTPAVEETLVSMLNEGMRLRFRGRTRRVIAIEPNATLQAVEIVLEDDAGSRTLTWQRPSQAMLRVLP